MTDIDAIRKTPLRLLNADEARWKAGDEAVNVKGDLFYTAAEYDAKCEELAAANTRFTDHTSAVAKFLSELAEYMAIETDPAKPADFILAAKVQRQWSEDKMSQVTRLEAERDAAVRDAQRYRWLRNPSLPVAIWIDGKLPFSVDAAIDAQLAALAPPTEQTSEREG